MFKHFILAVGVLSAAGSATAQTASSAAALCPKGELIMLRLNEITPGGTFEGFAAAAAANQKYYRDKGMNGNVQLVGRVLVRDATTGMWSVSAKDASTAHINPPGGRGQDVNDPAWKAFVAQYDANSKVTAQRMVCYMPAMDETAAITAAIEKLEQVWATAAAAGDGAGLGALLDDSYISYGKKKPETKADLIANTIDPKQRPASVKVSDVTVKVDGGYAFAQGLWTETATDGKVTALSFFDVWKQDRDGTWKAMMSQVGPVGP